MSRSYLAAVSLRHADMLSARFMAAADAMDPLVRSLLVDNVDPQTIPAAELLRALRQDGSAHDWASRETEGRSVRNVPQALLPHECAVLRAAVDAANMNLIDSVDGLLEHQLNLDVDEFTALLGEDAVARLRALALSVHDDMGLSVPDTAASRAAALAAGVCAAPFADQPHEMFVRRYSAQTRPWLRFHCDRSLLTMNIALSDDAAHDGGRLLAILEGRVGRCERSEGTATCHASTLLHAVTSMSGEGVRYSLILFYQPICPYAYHPMVRCDAATMECELQDSNPRAFVFVVVC